MAGAGGSDLTLEDVLRRAKPAWKKSDVAGAVDKLEAIAVENVQELRDALERGSINQDLQKFNLKGFTSSTLQALRDCLGVDARAQRTRPRAEDRNFAAPPGEQPREPPTAGRAPAAKAAELPTVQRDGTSEGPPEAGGPGEMKAHGIPVDQLEDPEAAADLLRYIKKVKTLSVPDLRVVIEEEGFAAEELLPRSMLVTAVVDVLIWKELSLAALQPLCRKKGLMVEDDQTRDELLELLAENSWVSVGVPLTRLTSGLTAAREILELVRGLREAGAEELRGMCAIAGLETEGMDESEMVDELRQIATWRQMEEGELYRECQANSVDPEGAATKEELMDRLVGCIQEGSWHTRGLPVERFGSAEMAFDLVQHVDRFQAMSVQLLQSELRKMRLPVDPRDAPQKMVFQLRDRLLWDHLPLAELRKEIKLRNITCKKLDPRNRAFMINVLLMDAYKDTIGDWESQGIPVQKMGSFDSMVQLVALYKSTFESMGFDDLLEWYKGLGYPDEQDLTRDDLLLLRAQVRVWQIMPLDELQAECSKCEVNLENARRCESEAERRVEFIHALIANNRLNAWDAQGLQVKRLIKHCNGKLDVIIELVKDYNSWCGLQDTELRRLLLSFGLPQDSTLNREQLLNILRTMMVWESLPYKELQQECAERGLPLRPEEARGDHEEGSALVHQLVVDMCVRACRMEYGAMGIPVEEMGTLAAGQLAMKLECLKSMSGKDVRLALEEFGVPCKLGTSKDELLKRLKRVTSWSALSVSGLRAECARQGIEFDQFAEGESEETRKSLIDSLLFCECKGLFEGLGLKPYQFASFKACAAVAREWVEIDELNGERLKAMCENLKGCNVFQMEKNDMRERLKQIAVWMHIPLKDLRDLCGEHNVPFDQFLERRAQVLLVAPAVWRKEATKREPHLPQASMRRPPAPGGYPAQTPAAKAPTIQTKRAAVAKHFQTLQVPIEADLDEVKKAYRRLALSYHPDKNKGLGEEVATERFRKVVVAYEAICEFLSGSVQPVQPARK